MEGVILTNILVKNGTLVSGKEETKSDLLIADGKIVAVGPELEDAGANVIDAAGCLVFPGFIDAHTHLEMPCAVGVTADDFPSGTCAAVAGGTTTIVDFASQDKGHTLEEGLEKWKGIASGRSVCDYSFHMEITDWSDTIPEQMETLCRKGVSSFKVYLAYDNLRLLPEQVGKILSTAARLGAVVGAHCEDGDAVNQGIAHQKELGHMGPSAHPASRPNAVEADAIAHFLDMAKAAGAEAYVVHLSTAEGLENIRKARKNGQTVWTETCPQYLMFTDEVYHLPDFEGAKYVCSPPMRSVNDRAALRDALRNGEIDLVSTDHCSFTLAQKALGKDDFSRIPNGLPVIEHRPAILYGLSKGECPMSASQLCAVLSENPARIFGMYPRKGSLTVGADADVVIWDPAAPMTISAATQHYATDYTPFEGLTLPGSPRLVLLRGETVAEKGRVTDALCGEFIPRKTK